MLPKLGLSEEQRTSIINTLNTILADEHVLYTKLRNYHWNVVGTQFFALHELFEQQYNLVKLKADKTAERVRAYGGHAIGTLTEFLRHARLQERPADYPDALGMVFNLIQDHEALVRNLREDARVCADEYGDVAIEDLLVDLMQEHQQMAWLLRSFIEGEPVHPLEQPKIESTKNEDVDLPESLEVQFSRQ